jgi:hypothetical protein
MMGRGWICFILYFEGSWGNYIALGVGSWIILIHGGMTFSLFLQQDTIVVLEQIGHKMDSA